MTDLAARQQAAEIVLTWTLPAETTEGVALKDLERVVVRGLEVEGAPPEAAVFAAQARELAVLPRPLEIHEAGERVEHRLPLPAATGRRMALAIESFSRRGRTEGSSNLVVIEIAQAPPAPTSLGAVPQLGAIRLQWDPSPGADGYHVYRRAGEQAPARVASVVDPAFEDPDVRLGAHYAYRVRSFVKTSSGPAESADSPAAEVVPQDTFPPSVPSGLEAVAGEGAVELSWRPSPEIDTAGYHIYRSAARLTRQPVTAPVFTDRDVRRQQQYSYAVSAVDAKGNESGQSAPVTVSVP